MSGKPEPESHGELDVAREPVERRRPVVPDRVHLVSDRLLDRAGPLLQNVQDVRLAEEQHDPLVVASFRCVNLIF